MEIKNIILNFAVQIITNKQTMTNKLAIKGHPTRGKEVIELLEMMGGIADNIQGNVDEQFYYIHEDGYIYTSLNNSPNNNLIFVEFSLILFVHPEL